MMFYICMAFVLALVIIEFLLRRRDRRLADERVARWLAFQIQQEAKAKKNHIGPSGKCEEPGCHCT